MEEMRRKPAARQQSAVKPGSATANADHRTANIDKAALSAFAIYLTLSIGFFGRALFGHFSVTYIGSGTDPALMAWFLAWWPHAIANHLNPILTRAIWAPSGLNLASQTSIPLAAAFASPLTLALGPVVAFNTLCLLSPALDGWCAFLLCRNVTRHYWASLLGGYIFGFSAFVLGQMTGGHLHMLLIFPVPLSVYLVARRMTNTIGERTFTLVLMLLLIAEFLLSIEIFATMTMFGAIPLLLIRSSGALRTRQDFVGLLKPAALAYALMLALVSPMLYYLFLFFFAHKPFFSPVFYSADLLNFLVPTQTNEIGRIALFQSVSRWFFHGWLSESGAYLSLPTLVVAAAYAGRHWREPLARVLICCLGVTVLLSLGPTLHVAGRSLPVGLPWLPFVHLPVTDNALPVRFSMYTSLILAMIVSLWLAGAEVRQVTRFGFAVAIVAFNLPNLSAHFWNSSLNTPAFFSGGHYRKYLQKGENVVILPYAAKGNSMFWQAETDMYFNMAEGSGAGWPEDFVRWPITSAFVDRTFVPDASVQLRAFLAAHEVNAVIVADRELDTWRNLLSTLNATAANIGGISIYRLKEQPERAMQTTLLDLRSRFDAMRIVAMVAAANKYLSENDKVSTLSMLKASELNLIPQDALIGPPPEVALERTIGSSKAAPRTPYDTSLVTDPHLAYGVWLGETSDGRVGMAEQAWYPAILPLMNRLRQLGCAIYFPYPSKLMETAPPPKEQDGWLLIAFTRAQLSQADELLKDYSTQAFARNSED